MVHNSYPVHRYTRRIPRPDPVRTVPLLLGSHPSSEIGGKGATVAKHVPATSNTVYSAPAVVGDVNVVKSSDGHIQCVVFLFQYLGVSNNGEAVNLSQF